MDVTAFIALREERSHREISSDVDTYRDPFGQRKKEVLIVTITIAAFFFVGLRAWSRGQTQLHYGLDDWILLVSLVWPKLHVHLREACLLQLDHGLCVDGHNCHM